MYYIEKSKSFPCPVKTLKWAMLPLNFVEGNKVN